MKFFYSAAVQNWDAEFYVKVDDNVDLDLGKYFLFHIIANVCSNQDINDKCFSI